MIHHFINTSIQCSKWAFVGERIQHHQQVVELNHAISIHIPHSAQSHRSPRVDHQQQIDEVHPAVAIQVGKTFAAVMDAILVGIATF